MKRIETLPLKTFWLLIACTLVAAGIVYAFLWRDAPYLATDSANYMGVARDLTDGRLDQFQVRPPGYPWLVMLSGSAENPARILFLIQLALYFSVIVLLIFLLLRMKVRRWLMVVFLLLMLLPYNVMPSSLVLTETLAQFLLVAGIFLLVLWLEGGKLWQALLCGVCLAYAGITRASYQVFSIFLAVLLVLSMLFLPGYRRRLWMAAAALAGTAILIVGSVCLHNYRSHGYFSITPLTGFNLTQKTARVLERLPDEYACIRELLIEARNASLLSEEDNHSYYNYIWEVPINSMMCGEVNTFAELSSYLTKMNLYLIRAAPLNYLVEVGYSLVNYTLPAVNRYADFGFPFLQILWSVSHFLTLGFFVLTCILIAGLAMIGLALPRRERQRLFQNWRDASRVQAWYMALSLLTVYYTLGLTILVEMGEARTRLSTEPLIISLAVLGIDLWLRVRSLLREKPPLPDHFAD